ncbi:MAG: hypothetical protein QM808_02800 [Steroidobacteraceae bacterium]
MLIVLFALWLATPHMTAQQQYVDGRREAVQLPWHLAVPAIGNRLIVDLQVNRLTPGLWQIIPDDELKALRINGQEVPLSAVGGGLTDWNKGFQFDLSPWLKPGSNQLEFSLDNHGGTGGLMLRPHLSFWHWLIIGGSFIPWLWLLSRWLGLGRAQFLLLALALIPLCIYWSATPWDVRTHDVVADGGHLDYIRYIAVEHALPQPNAGWTFYHPPLYYLSGAAVYAAAMQLSLSVSQVLQAYSLFLWLTFLCAGAACLQLLLRGKSLALLAATLALATWPSGIIHGIRIGNDLALYAMAGLATWHLLRWWRTNHRANLLWMAGFTALAFLCKSNAIVLLAAVVLLFAARTEHRCLRLRPVRASDGVWMLVIMLMGVALGLSTKLYYHWQGDLPNWLVGNANQLNDRLRVPVTLQNLLLPDVKTFLTHPWLDAWDDGTGRGRYWNYLLRSSLSGEFKFAGIGAERIAYLWGGLLLALLVLPLRSLRGLTIGHCWRNLPLLILAGVWLASLMALRIKVPYSCSNDFRYVLPVLIPFLVWCARSRSSQALLLVMSCSSIWFFMSM